IRTKEQDAAFLIDQSLSLDDRVATSHLIIGRDGAKNALEEAVIDDASEKLSNLHAAMVVPFKLPRWYSLAIVSLTGLAVALMIAVRAPALSEALAAERAEIENAAEHLEQTAKEVERAATPGSETARLAEEQAELGREFRRSVPARAEALKKLSSL